jgi:hypothetical protein
MFLYDKTMVGVLCDDETIATLRIGFMRPQYYVNPGDFIVS